ncbi:radical SAM family heme chaperone HemW [Lactovum miscens]|uniref:Heme chaperone HemW n=1 Tax=Lactovum miscens TaxID=190387 RepID=A0A841C545_9LACT|nr:radical SAM family heme chaperone HemW [Lactovum miscens]MBB5887555.1 oxygen-independent coproporphyrinogen-3 oxidase [Lactovum miscens]
MKSISSAYIHVPFCSQICYYCDFAKVLIEGQPVDDYVDELIKEFNFYNIKNLRTIYIGGGTPTTLSPEQMFRLISGISENLDLSVLEEFTVEANPGDLSDEMISVLASSPVNRISLGVQSFDDHLLKKIGRKHRAIDVYKSLEKLHRAGFVNVTIDLIYGLPNQTMEMVKADVAKFLELDLPHIALYSLILEDHTRFMNMQRSGLLHLPSDDKNADMYEYIMQTLSEKGYVHYEISNFSRPGYESKHNLTYWDNSEYFGFGAGASGYINGVRYKNHGPVHHYLEAAIDKKAIYEEVLGKKEKMEEEMFLGLRKAEGVLLKNFSKKFAIDFNEIYGEVLEKLLKTDLVIFDGERLSLSERGFELGNEVFEMFLLDR